MNTAVICARLGLKTAAVGNLGHDYFGNYVTEVLKKECVDTEGISRLEECQTAVNIILVGKHGERSILTAPQTNMNRMDLQERGAQLLKCARIICIGSLFTSRSLNKEMIQSVYDIAKDAGIITVADASFRDQDWVHKYGAYPWIDGVDYFIPSFKEGRLITGLEDPEEIVKVLSSHVNRAVVLKLGDKGCIACSVDGEIIRIPAFSVKPEDTTGAGDNFVAGFLWGLSKGYSLKACCYFACGVGALSTTRMGATAAVHSSEQVMEFMKSNIGEARVCH